MVYSASEKVIFKWPIFIKNLNRGDKVFLFDALVVVQGQKICSKSGLLIFGGPVLLVHLSADQTALLPFCPLKWPFSKGRR